MDAPLLKTKLHMPPLRPELVRRQRLYELLQAGAHRKLTLVSAPAGFGKTTLISDWIVRSERPAAWLTLEDSDNDPVRFLSYFMAALRTLDSELDKGYLGEYRTLRPSAIEPVMTELVNEISEKLKPFILVLDDYHLIQENTIHGCISFLLEHQPAQLHIVLCTRADPPLPVAVLRARGQLTEMRSADLRFTDKETAEFLNKLMGLDLAAADLAALASRTEGWIAGLQMAAVSLQDRPDTSAFIRSFTASNRYVLDYLVEEVLQRQPESLKRFLLETSILDRLNGVLCEAVTGRRDSQEVLEKLEHDNLFIDPVDSERHWYRYHRLFADLLRHRLAQTEPEALSLLHRRASAWYEANGLTTEAIDQSLSGNDFEKAMEMIEAQAETFMMRSEFTTLLNWVEMLPQDMICRRPLLCIYHAIVLILNGAPMNEIQARVASAFKEEYREQVAGQLAAFQAFLAALQGDLEECLNQSQRAIALLPEQDQFFRTTISRILANVSYAASGDVPKAVEIFEEGIRNSLDAGNLTVAVALLSELGELRIVQGELHRGKSAYQRALELAVDSKGDALPIAGLAMMGLGNLLREWNDLRRAEELLEGGIELVRKLGVIGTMDGYIALARLKQAQGKSEEADRLMETVHRIAIRFDASELDDLLVDIHRARLWIAQGNSEAAARWHREWLARRQKREAPFPYVLDELDRILQARILLAQDKAEAALKLLKQLQRSAEKLDRQGVVIEILLLQALACWSRKEADQAIEALEQALALAAPQGHMRSFLDEGPLMAQLLYEAASRGIVPACTGRLLSAFPLQPEAGKEAGEGQRLVEPLSQRELEVLRLLAEGSSNKDVARRLFISLPTVKWHTSNIYGKLGVKNRTQAAAKARVLGLLPAG